MGPPGLDEVVGDYGPEGLFVVARARSPPARAAGSRLSCSGLRSCAGLVGAAVMVAFLSGWRSGVASTGTNIHASIILLNVSPHNPPPPVRRHASAPAGRRDPPSHRRDGGAAGSSSRATPARPFRRSPRPPTWPWRRCTARPPARPVCSPPPSRPPSPGARTGPSNPWRSVRASDGSSRSPTASAARRLRAYPTRSVGPRRPSAAGSRQRGGRRPSIAGAAGPAGRATAPRYASLRRLLDRAGPVAGRDIDDTGGRHHLDLCAQANFDALVGQRGWSHRAYESWLTDMLVAALLPRA